MKEIGGYLEFPEFSGGILHDDAIALNSARNCLAYLIETKGIKSIALPQFLCDSIEQTCRKYNVKIRFYSIGADFLPLEMKADADEWIYLVNYYGQIKNSQIVKYKKKYRKLIVDNVQAYFQEPADNVDTIYTCRKFLGVSDGAFLYTDVYNMREIELDKSADRMTYLLGRYENTASEYYATYVKNEKKFETYPLRQMSELTKNLLRAIDYNWVEKTRRENFCYLKNCFDSINQLKLQIPNGPFMYPLYLPNGADIRRLLQKKCIYIPMLWPEVLERCGEGELENDMAKNILPIPIDQRYTVEDMKYVSNIIQECLSIMN